MKKICALFGLLACLWSAANPAAEVDIVGFGDSITQGLFEVGFPPNGLRIGGYEPRLEALFESMSVNTAIVKNYGVGGERTSAGVGRIGGVLFANPGAKYLLLLEGVNDFFGGLSLQTTLFNLRSMIQQTKAAGITPFIGTLTPYPLSGVVSGVYNPNIFGLAASEGITVVDLHSALNPNWGALQAGDLLHPNGAGYAIMADVWCAAIFECTQEAVDVIPWVFGLLLEGKS